ncbi:hypothetical protein GPECTOR_182g263 [Gonium pectorale]|uniref:Uncharacterized protein n=1 Tax=Gonium pectorale TaxID=33097 RepID=A0A150FX98_GONPE|nr:hypothetical protein GPECTOR_182g263 [Gonium pectorale]|eukprot:KXZ42208.1 hypothetical protein GPECTOR_182g263 [Gonium pectorale]
MEDPACNPRFVGLKAPHALIVGLKRNVALNNRIGELKLDTYNPTSNRIGVRHIRPATTAPGEGQGLEPKNCMIPLENLVLLELVWEGEDFNTRFPDKRSLIAVVFSAALHYKPITAALFTDPVNDGFLEQLLPGNDAALDALGGPKGYLQWRNDAINVGVPAQRFYYAGFMPSYVPLVLSSIGVGNAGPLAGPNAIITTAGDNFGVFGGGMVVFGSLGVSEGLDGGSLTEAGRATWLNASVQLMG